MCNPTVVSLFSLPQIGFLLQHRRLEGVPVKVLHASLWQSAKARVGLYLCKKMTGTQARWVSVKFLHARLYLRRVTVSGPRPCKKVTGTPLAEQNVVLRNPPNRSIILDWQCKVQTLAERAPSRLFGGAEISRSTRIGRV